LRKTLYDPTISPFWLGELGLRLLRLKAAAKLSCAAFCLNTKRGKKPGAMFAEMGRGMRPKCLKTKMCLMLLLYLPFITFRNSRLHSKSAFCFFSLSPYPNLVIARPHVLLGMMNAHPMWVGASFSKLLLFVLGGWLGP